MLRSDDGAPEPAGPVDDYYYPDGAYYYVETDDKEYFRRLPGRRPAPFQSSVVVLLSLLKATLSNYVCTQILMLSLTLVFELIYSSPRGPWLVI